MQVNNPTMILRSKYIYIHIYAHTHTNIHTSTHTKEITDQNLSCFTSRSFVHFTFYWGPGHEQPCDDKLSAELLVLQVSLVLRPTFGLQETENRTTFSECTHWPICLPLLLNVRSVQFEVWRIVMMSSSLIVFFFSHCCC